MKPLGKLTLAILGLRFFGAPGFFWGMFLGHIFIDRTILSKILLQKLNILDDNIRIMLPYKYYVIYNRLSDNILGKVWGFCLGYITFGFWGIIVVSIIGHFTFDYRSPRLQELKICFEDLWNKHLIKIFGAILGFSCQSHLLMFIGILAGFFADNFRIKSGLRTKLKLGSILTFWTHINPIKMRLFSLKAKDVIFLQSMAGLSAKISKADGKVTENEIHLFKKIFHISAEQNSQIAKIFNLAKDSSEGYERYAKQIKVLCRNNIELQESIIDNLFKIATVDTISSSAQLDMLRDISDIIGLPIGNFEVIKKRFEQRKPTDNITDFYEILGVFYNASDNEIKRRWKELINEYHPDRIQANGGSPEEIAAGSYRMAEINNAYQNIMKSRKVA